MATAKKAQASSKSQSSKKTNQGEEVFRKLFLAGLGLMEETNERLHDTFNSLVKKGKTREPEIKRAVEDIRKKAQARRKDLEKKFQGAIRENEIVKSKEFQSLLKKLEDFEKKFTQKKGGAAKKSTGGSTSSASSASRSGAAKTSAKKRSAGGAKKRSSSAGKTSAQKTTASPGTTTTTSATTGGTTGSSNQ